MCVRVCVSLCVCLITSLRRIMRPSSCDSCVCPSGEWRVRDGCFASVLQTPPPSHRLTHALIPHCLASSLPPYTSVPQHPSLPHSLVHSFRLPVSDSLPPSLSHPVICVSLSHSLPPSLSAFIVYPLLTPSLPHSLTPSLPFSDRRPKLRPAAPHSRRRLTFWHHSDLSDHARPRRITWAPQIGASHWRITWASC